MEYADNHEVTQEKRGKNLITLQHSITLDSVEDAEDMFLLAKERLMDVNRWHELTEEPANSYMLTDHHGHPVSRYAHMGDSIVAPTLPGTEKEGGGLCVTSIIYDDYPDDNTEIFTLVLTETPMGDKEYSKDEQNVAAGISHAYACNIERHGRIVLSHCYIQDEGVPSGMKKLVRNLLAIPNS